MFLRTWIMTFPRWSYFPRNERHPAWVKPLVDLVQDVEQRVSTPLGGRLKSDGVLLELAPGLAALGYTVEKGKQAEHKISRPVLFGEGGRPAVTMEVDAFHDELGIAVEVEAGRAWNGNAVYRDLIRASLLLDARFLVLMLPLAYSPPSVRQPIPAYANTQGLMDAIYASQRLQLPFEGVLLIGY
jgi:hypothetical protein